MKPKKSYVTLAGLAALVALLLAACMDRTYDNPFVSDSGSAISAAWKTDSDGDGIADSVEAYAGNCKGTPAECLALAWDSAQASAKTRQDSTSNPIPPKDTSIAPPKDTVTVPIPPKDTFDVPIPPRDTVRDTVIAPPRTTAATGIEAEAIYIPLGVQKAHPSVSVLPRDADNHGYTLQSLDDSIVKVSGEDLVPVKPGSATIRARSDDGGFTVEFQAKVLVTDTNRYETQISVAPMQLVADAEAQAPVITWKPADVTTRGYALTSADPGIVLVVMEGDIPKCKPISAGKAEVTLKTLGKGLTAVFTVTVKAAPILTLPVLSISAADISLVLGGADVTPKASYLPESATNKAYTLKSASPGVVSVSGSQLHAVAGGSASITITSVDGPSSTFKATVSVPLESISADDLEIEVGAPNVTPAVSFIPSSASNKSYTLKSANPAVVTVSGTQLHAVAGGTATITVTSADGPKSTFNVNVPVHVKAITAPDLQLALGETSVIVPVFSPENPDNAAFTLSSDAPGKVSVSGKKVQAEQNGKAIITMVADDGGVKGTFTVMVTKKGNGGLDLTDLLPGL
ncbi:MAG: Ig-like domain-containing protein [Fibrobacteria bacterium]